MMNCWSGAQHWCLMANCLMRVRWKLALFAGVILCGVGIRLALISHFRTWAIMARDGPTDATNAIIRRTYGRATSVLLLLWLFIAAIAVLSVWKPA